MSTYETYEDHSAATKKNARHLILPLKTLQIQKFAQVPTCLNRCMRLIVLPANPDCLSQSRGRIQSGIQKKSSIVWKNSGRWAIVSAISSSVPPSISTLTTTKSSTDADAIKQRKKLSRWAKLPERASGHGFTTTGTLNKRPLWRTLSGTERHHNLVSEMRFPRYRCRQTQYSDFCTCYGTRVLRGLVQNHGCNCRPPSWNLELMFDWCKPRSKNLVRCLGRLPEQEISVIMGVRSHKILKTSAFFRLKSSAVS